MNTEVRILASQHVAEDKVDLLSNSDHGGAIRWRHVKQWKDKRRALQENERVRPRYRLLKMRRANQECIRRQDDRLALMGTNEKFYSSENASE